MTESYTESSFTREDESFELPLRPDSLESFAGQPQVHERLGIYINAAKARGETLGHCLFHGPPGLGKTTLAGIIANAMGVNLVTTSGPILEKVGDLAGILTNLQEGDVLFIDEIHRLSRTVEEYLYPAVEDFKLDLLLDSGPSARSVQVKLKPFTLVGATTRIGLLSSPMRTRFGFNCRLDFYPDEVLAGIVKRSSSILGMQMQSAGALEIARRSRGTPRIANNLLRFARDYAQLHTDSIISQEAACKALDTLAIDHLGLDEMDTKLLTVMIDHFEGGPVGLSTLAAAVSEDANTIEEVHEPFLITQGLIKRTPRGRVATPKAYTHLGKGE